uniref:Uncharacterized protein n=1 Tax=Sphaerodactylus townsendi TaxID=933632 RepID=A0ACB8F079_9SAUR
MQPYPLPFMLPACSAAAHRQGFQDQMNGICLSSIFHGGFQRPYSQPPPLKELLIQIPASLERCGSQVNRPPEEGVVDVPSSLIKALCREDKVHKGGTFLNLRH